MVLKTAAMFEFNDPATRVFDDAMLGAIRQAEQPPHHVKIWMMRAATRGERFRLSHTGFHIADKRAVAMGDRRPAGFVGQTVLSADRVTFIVRYSTVAQVDLDRGLGTFAEEPSSLYPPTAGVDWPAPSIDEDGWRSLVYGEASLGVVGMQVS